MKQYEEMNQHEGESKAKIKDFVLQELEIIYNPHRDNIFTKKK